MYDYEEYFYLIKEKLKRKRINQLYNNWPQLALINQA